MTEVGPDKPAAYKLFDPRAGKPNHPAALRAKRHTDLLSGPQWPSFFLRAETPKIERPGGSSADFLIQDQRGHGVAGLINLFGIESPGLTSSLAIADWVARIVRETRAAT